MASKTFSGVSYHRNNRLSSSINILVRLKRKNSGNFLHYHQLLCFPIKLLGGIVLVGLWLVFGYFAQLVCNSVGFLYPAYMSIKAIESKSKDDDTKWLTYWVVFAIFSIAEYFADFIVGWFPLYWLIKCVFMVWLMIPTGFNGSLILYNRIIKPYFLKHEHNLDDVVNKVKDSAHKVFDKRE